MESKSSVFQTIFLSVLGFTVVVAMLLFAFNRGGTGIGAHETLIWGTVSSDDFAAFMRRLQDSQGSAVKVMYEEKDEETFEDELVEAFASGRGPDVFLLPQDLILRQQDKIFPIPYTSITERDFKDLFIKEAELYMNDEGILAVPFLIDPLVMYWNRDIFSNSGIPKPPATWAEFLTIASQMTIRDESANIARSAIALGEFRNVTNAKEIVSALTLQAGSPLVRWGEDGVAENVFADRFSLPLPPAEAALNFYIQFANPSKVLYSWNRSLPSSKNFFLAGDLATYFGFASEAREIAEKNQNLDFDVALLPQTKGAKNKVTFGKMQGFAIAKNSKYASDAFKAISLLTSKASLAYWTEVTGLPPVRRDLLSEGSSDAFGPIFYDSAVRSLGWLDPDKEETASIFQTMIENSLSGRERAGEMVTRASREMSELVKTINEKNK